MWGGKSEQVSGWEPLFLMEATGKKWGVLNETSKILKSVLKQMGSHWRIIKIADDCGRVIIGTSAHLY